MAAGRRRCVWYAIAGAALSTGAPVGLLVLRELSVPRPLAEELLADRLTYLYVFLAMAVVLTTLGFVLGRQADRLAQLSATDSLTGLLNRRAFRRRLDDELQRSKRYGASVSLMLADVDGLKRINDEHGHSTGDHVISDVAAAIMGTLRGTDFGARWGGDEFALVAPDTTPPAALRSAERLAAQVSQWAGSHRDCRITLSIGIASFDPAQHADLDIDALVRAADDALYLAKASGRNRIRVADRVERVAPRFARDR